MRTLFLVLLTSLVVGACTLRRDTPDETRVQSLPEWRPAPNDNLPLPQ